MSDTRQMNWFSRLNNRRPVPHTPADSGPSIRVMTMTWLAMIICVPTATRNTSLP